jgi:CspA family cold shock protein
MQILEEDFFMPTGVIKWFNDKKGFGFIQCENGEKDVFVHYSVIQEDGYKSLTQGQLVEYSFVQGPKGPLATDVQKL